MAFNRLFNAMGKLVETEEEIPAKMPCKPEILALRECVKSKGGVCGHNTVDLLTCQAAYKVEMNEKVRENMGIAQYNEYVLEMEDKYGKEKAAEVISGPAESLKDLQALQTFLKVANGEHPKGAPKTQKEAEEWTYADQARLEMGEYEYFQHAAIVAAEFGPGKGEKISGVGKSYDKVYEAMMRLYAKTQ